MGLQTHLFRRNATYAWRRRLPAQIVSVRLSRSDGGKECLLDVHHG